MFKIYKKNQGSNIVTNNKTNIKNDVKKQTNLIFNTNSSRNCQQLKFAGNVKCGSCGGVR